MRVLIVDDQIANRLLLESLVGGFGYEVVCAASGQEVIDNFQAWKPDLVLLDVMMPGISGYQLAPKIKALSGVVHLPIIFITAIDEQEALLRCLAVGGDDFLPLPFEPVVLQAKLRAHQRVRELSQAIHEKNKRLMWHSSRVEREHKIVQHIFRNALSRNFTHYPHIETHVTAASEFSGDLCLVAAGPLGNIYVFMGDFTGHGLAPATGALPLSQAFFAMAERGVAVAEMVTEFNERLLQLLPDDMFCAGIMLELSACGERLTYWNGGMVSGYVLNDEGQITAQLRSQHMALGILAEDEFDHSVSTLSCKSNERVVIFTDGVTELPNEAQQRLGESGFEAILTSRRSLSLADIIADLETYRGGHEHDDDMSLALLRCCPSKLASEPDIPAQTFLPFKLQVQISAHEMQQTDPVATLMNSLSQLPALRAHRGTIFMLLSEAYNNALEHGILGLESSLKEQDDGFTEYYRARDQRLAELSSGEIAIELEFLPRQRQLIIRIRDSGTTQREALARATETQSMTQALAHGRGLLLMQELTESMRWLDDGHTLEVVYQVS